MRSLCNTSFNYLNTSEGTKEVGPVYFYKMFEGIGAMEGSMEEILELNFLNQQAKPSK